MEKTPFARKPTWLDGLPHAENYAKLPEAETLLPRLPGSYLLVFAWDAPLHLSVGRLGPVTLPAGVWVYAGSAWGPGGLAARVRRHLRPAPRAHWHVDYLTECVRPVAVAWTVQTETPRERLECVWAQALLTLPGAAAPVASFGARDCRRGCPAHLVQVVAFSADPPGNGFAPAPGLQ